MSIDTRLRVGLKANTEHLGSSVDVELQTILKRARRRTQWRVAAAVGVAAAAALASVVRPGLDLVPDDAQLAEQPSLPASVGDAPLEPGRYSASFAGADSSTPRAVLEVPPGFKGFQGFAVTGAEEGSVLELGFWTAMTTPTEPCGSGAYVDRGPSVRDLAGALARNKVTEATPPRPTTLAGHEGLRLTLRLPANFDIDRCPGQRVQLWKDARGGNRYLEQPGQRLRLWILDLDGQRVVVNASDGPANTAEEVAGVTRMLRAVTFARPPGG